MVETSTSYFIIHNQFVKQFLFMQLTFLFYLFGVASKATIISNNRLQMIKAQLIIWFLNAKKQRPLAELFLINSVFTVIQISRRSQRLQHAPSDEHVLKSMIKFPVNSKNVANALHLPDLDNRHSRKQNQKLHPMICKVSSTKLFTCICRDVPLY